MQFKNVFKVLQVWGLHESIKSGAHTFVLLPHFRLTDTRSAEEEQIPVKGLRADVFTQALPVRCVRSLWAQWHFCDTVLKVEKLTGSITGRPVLAMRLTVMWQQCLQYYGRNLPSGMMWRWVRHPPSLSANSTLQRRKWFEPLQREPCLFSEAVCAARDGMQLDLTVESNIISVNLEKGC